MAQQLRAFSTLAEDLDSSPSTHMCQMTMILVLGGGVMTLLASEGIAYT